MTSIAMYRLLGSTHIGQIVTVSGKRSGTVQRMTGGTAVVILLSAGIPLYAATAVHQLLVAEVESVSAQEIGSRTGDAVGPLAAGVGLAIE